MYVRKAGLVWSLRSDIGGSKLRIDNLWWSTSVCTSAVTGTRSDILPFPPLPMVHDLNKWPTSSFCQDLCFILFIFIDSLVYLFIGLSWVFPSCKLLSFLFLPCSSALSSSIAQIITCSSCTAHVLEDLSCAVSGVRLLTANAYFSLPVFGSLFSLTATKVFVCVLLLLSYSHIFEFWL